uniref:Exodeoxyribonuclease 7 small subunit n=1 Tax=Candidatus Kentrum sp. DK TaxID=2126562 RepID=A0A450RZ06_9GAMM|nr:MAG: Exodeoxyribonuclease VII small subunit [Candidatus Kentron sp. DK]
MTAAKKKTATANGPKGSAPEAGSPVNRHNFEESMAELERLVTHMEQGELSLEEMLENFERGMALSKACRQAIDEAEQRVRILMEKEGDQAVEPFREHLSNTARPDEELP